mgnify:CR=1 FL=1
MSSRTPRPPTIKPRGLSGSRRIATRSGSWGNAPKLLEDAEKLAESEAQAIAIYADAFQRDPQFFEVWRTLQAYRETFSAGQSRLVLTPGGDFLRLLNEMPRPAAGRP